MPSIGSDRTARAGEAIARSHAEGPAGHQGVERSKPNEKKSPSGSAGDAGSRLLDTAGDAKRGATDRVRDGADQLRNLAVTRGERAEEVATGRSPRPAERQAFTWSPQRIRERIGQERGSGAERPAVPPPVVVGTPTERPTVPPPGVVNPPQAEDRDGGREGISIPIVEDVAYMIRAVAEAIEGVDH